MRSPGTCRTAITSSPSTSAGTARAPGHRPALIAMKISGRPRRIHPAASPRQVRADRHLDGRHHRDDLCRPPCPRLSGLVINDIGPDAEAGTQRITQMVGSRPDDFATLEDAMAYRRSASPILAARSAEDQHELALG